MVVVAFFIVVFAVDFACACAGAFAPAFVFA